MALGYVGKLYGIERRVKDASPTGAGRWSARTKVGPSLNNYAPGCDGLTLTEFGQQRDRNLYKIWNRLCSGTYFPPPVREKRIPKDNGKERVLAIPTVSDSIAQGAVKRFVEAKPDPIFHDDSFGYRPGRSAHDAIRQCATRCRQYSWVLEVDIPAFFDHLRHDLVIKALEHHQMPRWVILYCRRWLEAPMQRVDGEVTMRTRGTPRGGSESNWQRG